MIAAVAANGVIGVDGRLPWKIEEDWEYFLRTTAGGVLVMGRVCFEEMRALAAVKADRRFVVLSRSRVEPPAVGASSLPEGIERARELGGPIWICGGEGVYREAMPLAKRLYLTRVGLEVEGDRRFPEWRADFTRLLSSLPSAGGPVPCTFEVWERGGRAPEGDGACPRAHP